MVGVMGMPIGAIVVVMVAVAGQVGVEMRTKIVSSGLPPAVGVAECGCLRQ